MENEEGVSTMKLQGTITKAGREWLAEIPALDLMTQGTSKNDALAMIADAVESLVDHAGFKAHATLVQGGTFLLGSNAPGKLVALLLRRQREASGLSIAEVSDRLGQTSRNGFARYETGDHVPSIDKLDELLHAVNPEADFIYGPILAAHHR